MTKNIRIKIEKVGSEKGGYIAKKASIFLRLPLARLLEKAGSKLCVYVFQPTLLAISRDI